MIQDLEKRSDLRGYFMVRSCGHEDQIVQGVEMTGMHGVNITLHHHKIY